MRHLAVDWLALGRRIGARDDVAGAGANLLGRWAEPHRAYHDLAHLDEVLTRVDLLADAADDADAVRLAAWFHDAVYDPKATDNEERSAWLATTMLHRLQVPEPTVARVARLVRVTAAHEVADGDRDGAVLCDADLGVLAATAERYSTYVDGVRREYAHVDDASFARGRAAVLRGLVAHEPLFRTAYGHEHWESGARANVLAELAHLER
jgi:predicted metal-dependent HD superfamily phosphohydrolase